MSTKEVDDKHREGAPWRIEQRCVTFEEADKVRNNLLNENDNLQVKIRWMRQRDDFAVKARIDPAITAQEEAVKRREEKKRRKAKLNKKRRKK